MHCLRLARAFTGRTKLLKFEGNFHGYHDQVMYAIGTPADRTRPGERPDRLPRLDRHAGRARTATSSSCPTTGPTCSRRPFARHAHELAAVICEPVYYNAGCILPDAGVPGDAPAAERSSTACC